MTATAAGNNGGSAGNTSVSCMNGYSNTSNSMITQTTSTSLISRPAKRPHTLEFDSMGRSKRPAYPGHASNNGGHVWTPLGGPNGDSLQTPDISFFKLGTSELDRFLIGSGSQLASAGSLQSALNAFASFDYGKLDLNNNGSPSFADALINSPTNICLPPSELQSSQQLLQTQDATVTQEQEQYVKGFEIALQRLKNSEQNSVRQSPLNSYVINNSQLQHQSTLTAQTQQQQYCNAPSEASSRPASADSAFYQQLPPTQSSQQQQQQQPQTNETSASSNSLAAVSGNMCTGGQAGLMSSAMDAACSSATHSTGMQLHHPSGMLQPNVLHTSVDLMQNQTTAVHHLQSQRQQSSSSACLVQSELSAQHQQNLLLVQQQHPSIQSPLLNRPSSSSSYSQQVNTCSQSQILNAGPSNVNLPYIKQEKLETDDSGYMGSGCTSSPNAAANLSHMYSYELCSQSNTANTDDSSSAAAATAAAVAASLTNVGLFSLTSPNCANNTNSNATTSAGTASTGSSGDCGQMLYDTATNTPTTSNSNTYNNYNNLQYNFNQFGHLNALSPLNAIGQINQIDSTNLFSSNLLTNATNHLPGNTLTCNSGNALVGLNSSTNSNINRSAVIGGHNAVSPNIAVGSAQHLIAANGLDPINMHDQERIKLERKRMRNRIAASKCRKRKLERISKLEEKVNVLKGDNDQLSKLVHKLRSHVASLKHQVMEHVNSGCNIHPSNMANF